MNKIILVGNVGVDPEYKTFDSGDIHSRFTMATEERWIDKQTNEKRKKVEWHRCNAYGKLAKVIQEWVKKGSKILVEGKVLTRSYGPDDDLRYITEVRVSSVEFLKSAPSAQSQPPQPSVPSQPSEQQSSGKQGKSKKGGFADFIKKP